MDAGIARIHDGASQIVGEVESTGNREEEQRRSIEQWDAEDNRI